MYDIVIIGAGIAGLHCAYRLQDQYDSILVLEKSPCLGGRIRSVSFHGTTVEAGAGRLNQTHRLYHDLLQELQIQTKSIPSALSYFKPNSIYHNRDPFDILTSVLESAKREPVEKLQGMSFLDYAKTKLSPDEIRFVTGGFGYYEQLVSMNAYNAVNLFSQGMHTKNDFSVVPGGMSQVIQGLYKKLLERKKCRVRCNQEVGSIVYDPNFSQFRISIKGSQTILKCRHCIAAIPKDALLKLQYCKPYYPLLKSIDVKILCRIYAKFRKRDIWFHDLPKTTVNNEIRYIIPIDRENGIIMISYSDSKYARFWGSLDKRRLISTLQHKLESALCRPIPRPKEVQAFYWNTGTAFWKPGVDSRKLAPRILQPDQQVSFYICGENYSENQGWIEGALESSNQVIQSLQNI